jgi:hypothetical protein
VSEPAFADREGLARLLDGPAAELEKRLGAPDVALERVFSLLGPGRLDADRGHRPFLVQFEVRASDGVHTHAVWFSPELQLPGDWPSNRRPALSYSVDLFDFLLMAAGRLDPHQAFMSGRLRMSGDMTLAEAVEAWLTPA